MQLHLFSLQTRPGAIQSVGRVWQSPSPATPDGHSPNPFQHGPSAFDSQTPVRPLTTTQCCLLSALSSAAPPLTARSPITQRLVAAQRGGGASWHGNDVCLKEARTKERDLQTSSTCRRSIRLSAELLNHINPHNYRFSSFSGR